jgi:hypothetical protein
MLFVFRNAKEILGESMRCNWSFWMIWQSRWCCEYPAIVAGFLGGDRDAVVIWFPGANAAINKPCIKEFVLEIAVVLIAVKEFIPIVEVRVPATAKLAAGLLSIAEFAEEFAFRVGYDAEETLPVSPKEDGWGWLVSCMVVCDGTSVVQFSTFDAWNEFIADGIGDIGKGDDVNEHSAVVDNAFFFWSKGATLCDEVH